MLLRVFKRAVAGDVKPGSQIETPKKLAVEEVAATLSGVRIVGKSPTSTKRTTLELKDGDPVDVAVPDPSAVDALIRRAFKALAAQVKDDEIREGQDGYFEWQVTDGDLSVLCLGQWLRLSWVDGDKPSAPGPVAVKETAEAGKGKAATK